MALLGIVSNMIKFHTVSCTWSSGWRQLPLLLISPAGLKVSDRCSMNDRGSNTEGRAEEVVIIDRPLLLWALGEFVLCPLVPYAPLHSFLTEQLSQHFETATLKRRAQVYHTNEHSLALSFSIYLSLSLLSLTSGNRRGKTWVKSLLSGKCTSASSLIA